MTPGILHSRHTSRGRLLSLLLLTIVLAAGGQEHIAVGRPGNGGSSSRSSHVQAGRQGSSTQRWHAPPLRIMPMGDSITDGYNVPGGWRTDFYAQVARSGRDFDLVGSMHSGPSTLPDLDDEGHVGMRIDQIAAQADGWLATYQPDYILLMIGTNDLLQGYQVSSAADRLGCLLDQIILESPGSQVLVSSLLPIAHLETWVDAFNARVPELVQERADAGARIDFVDMHAVLTLADLADGIHPSEEGYAKLADAWTRAFFNELMEGPFR